MGKGLLLTGVMCIQHLYDLVISESSVEDACQHLELFLESYWASTRSEVLD